MIANRILSLSARLLHALGLASLLLGGYLLWQSNVLGGEAVHLEGTVVSYREIADGGETRYRPRVRFEAENGSIISFDGQLATTARRFEIGAAVPVVYPRADPQKARIASFADNWSGVIAAFSVGGLALLGGIFIRRAVRREAQGQP